MIPDHKPWEYQGSEQVPTGITVDIVNSFSEFSGRSVKIIWYDQSTIFKALSSGEIDCAISSLPITEEQQTLYDLSDPYTKTYPILLIRKDSPVISKQQLNQQTTSIAVIEYTKYAEFARSEFSSAQIEGFPNRTAAVSAVKSGQCDVFIDDALSVVTRYKESPEAFRVNPAPLTDKFQYYAVFIQKDDRELKEQWNDFFTQKRNDQYFETLSEKYITPDQELLKFIDIVITL